MDDNVCFYGCRFLDFDDNYTAEKNLISSSGITKVTWFRKSHFDLVQFCKKRGRINSPIGCLDEEMKHCSDYEDFYHSVPLASINVED